MSQIAAAVPLDSFETFGAFLKYLRRRARLTQFQLALATGYSEAHVCRLERDQRPPDLTALTALFVPALEIQARPELVGRMLQLAVAARGERLPQSVTLTAGIPPQHAELPAASACSPVQLLPSISPGRAELPVYLSSFVGRVDELRGITCLLVDHVPAVRLLTVTGPPGIGKTRLAVRAAGELAGGFRDGVTFVPLAPVRDARLVGPTIAQVLGVREQPGRSLLESLAATLRGKEQLLLLDNFEQVVAAAPLLAALLAACPALRILVTSRAVLHLEGEQSFPVPPLALPDLTQAVSLDRLLEYDGVRLFVDRAAAASPTFTLTAPDTRSVAFLRHELDGTPLAIELAAARMRVLTVEQILDRRDDALRVVAPNQRAAEPRQHTLRAAIDWSYDLLSDNERRLFNRLSVFADGWTLEAAEEVCAAAPLAGSDVLPLLAQLVDQSLVLTEQGAGKPRYRLLEVLRQYGAEKLEQTAELATLYRRHAAWFRRLAEAADWQSSEEGEWRQRLLAEDANLHAALRRLEAAGAIEEALRLAGALSPFWRARGHVLAGHATLQRLLDRATACPAAVRAKALQAAADLACYAGNYAAAAACTEGAVALWRVLGDQRGLAASLAILGWIVHHQHDYCRAEALYAEALACWRLAGHPAGVADVFQRLGVLAQEQGDRGRAAARYGEAYRLRQEIDAPPYALASSLDNLAGLAEEDGAYGRATALHLEALALRRNAGDLIGVAGSCEGLATVAREGGDFARAVALGEEAVAICRELDERDQYGHMLYSLCLSVYRQGDHDRAVRLGLDMVAVDRERGITVDIARHLEGLAATVGQGGAPEGAVRLLGAAAALREAAAVPPSNPAHHEGRVNDVRSALSPDVFAAAWAAGQAMTPEEAIAGLVETA